MKKKLTGPMKKVYEAWVELAISAVLSFLLASK